MGPPNQHAFLAPEPQRGDCCSTTPGSQLSNGNVIVVALVCFCVVVAGPFLSGFPPFSKEDSGLL